MFVVAVSGIMFVSYQIAAHNLHSQHPELSKQPPTSIKK